MAELGWGLDYMERKIISLGKRNQGSRELIAYSDKVGEKAREIIRQLEQLREENK